MNACKSILVVEDDVEIRESLKEIFECDNHTVFLSTNGQEAFQHLKEKGHPAIIFLDIHMPIMDGHTFFKILKADEKLSQIPIVVMSAGDSLKDFKNANAVIKKPFDLGQILKVAKTYCCVPSIF